MSRAKNFNLTKPPPKLLFFVTVDWFFCSHFLARAISAKNAGFDVFVMTNVDRHGDIIKSAGLKLISINIDRRSINPFAAVYDLLKIIKVYISVKPDLLHHVALKPILLGSLAAKVLKHRRVVNAVVGMGYAFTSPDPIVRMISRIIKVAFKFLINPLGSKVIFENAEDRNQFVKEGTVNSEDAVLIRGAGVAPEKFSSTEISVGVPVVILVARLLRDKGLGEFVAAARILRDQGITARFWIVGGPDLGNRASINEKILSSWRDEGVVELLGHRDDVNDLLAQSHIACLPSYREGLPKSLLEAMAAGLPCVTTDVPGCREVVRDGDNGILVPSGDSLSLAHALKILIQDATLRKRMGERSRQRVEQEFSEDIVVSQTLTVYRDMLCDG